MRKDIYKDGVDTQFKPQGDLPSDVPLASKPVCVILPIDVDEVLRSIPARSAWLRRVITEAAKVELLGESPAPGADSPAANSGAEPAPAGVQLDTAELLQLIDQAVGMTKAKDIKPVLLKLRERLIQ